MEDVERCRPSNPDVKLMTNVLKSKPVLTPSVATLAAAALTPDVISSITDLSVFASPVFTAIRKLPA